MQKVKDFFNKCKLPILWTIGYLFVIWAIMQILFDFDIFNRMHWLRIAHMRLHGPYGFVFGIILLAAVPLYIATTLVVIRTKKFLFTLPVPKILPGVWNKLFAKKENPGSQPEEVQGDATPEPMCEQKNEKLAKIPAEMHAAFARAACHPNRLSAPICSVCSVTPNVYPDAPQAPDAVNDFPLPPDFDSGAEFEMPTEPMAPVFQDIDLYGTGMNFVDTPGGDEENPVEEYLKKTNRLFTVDDNIIVTENAAIVVHNDPDFWIMDEPTWFAAGKTRESPIAKLIDVAKQNNVAAVIYLGETNIMNFDEKCAEWTNAGVRVVKKLEDL